MKRAPDPRGSGRSAFAFPHELVSPTVAPFDSARLVAEVARRLRIQYPGALYHVINRGNYRRDIFETAGAARAFEQAMAEACFRPLAVARVCHHAKSFSFRA